MAYLFIPKSPDRELPVFFNLDGVVGASPASNQPEDVLLIQFIFSVMGANPLPTTPASMTAIYRAVNVTGVIDAQTIAAIRSEQEDRKKSQPGTVADGRVSPAVGGYFYGGGMYSIARLNDNLQHRNIGIWPRIDLIPGCPAGLKAMVTRTVSGI